MGRWGIEIDSVVPGVLVLGVAFVVAHAIATYSRFYRDTLGALDSGRYGEIDGLRGFLALSVFLSHVVSSYYWYQNGLWSWPASTVYTLCGSAPVSLFFMVTGFLFWRRSAAAPGGLAVAAFLRSRLRRLAPLYFACLVLIFAIIGVKTQGKLAVPPLALAGSLAEWACFGFLGFPDINGLEGTSVIDPALWTLRYEWLFYMALPALSFLATPVRLAGLVLVAAILLALGHLEPLDYAITNFLVGMIVAQFAVSGALPTIFTSRAAAVLALLPLLGIGLAGDGDYSIHGALALAPLFAVVAAGNTLFGALSLRAARCLGLVSYSTYVLHGALLYVALGLMNRFTAVKGLDPAAYWSLMLGLGAALVGISAVTYRWIEHPFIARSLRRH
jgi:peptidoglycan/LPS O-acetylase OafA/YrhL